MRPTVLIEAQVDPANRDRLAAHAALLTPQKGPTPDLAALARADAVILGSMWKMTPDVLDAAPRLKLISRPGIGLDNIDVPAATARGIVVAHVPDGPTESTAEHTVALLLALAKRLPKAQDAVRRGDYRRDPLLGTELRGKTLGLVGIGRIGARVGAILNGGFAMRVLAYDPGLPAEEIRRRGAEPVMTLDELLDESDIISLHVPLTPETSQMIGAAQLARMRPGAYLINCARGGLVDENALADALASGHLAGAGIDAFEQEPPPADHPLLSLPNAICTPHTASVTREGLARMATAAVDNVLATLRGDRPNRLANPEVWETRRRWE